jgi:hypothetical protein
VAFAPSRPTPALDCRAAADRPDRDPDDLLHVGAGAGGPGRAATILLAGVSTDCCVLSTATAAADAGVPVQVVADACAGVDEASHRKTLEVLALYAPLVEIVTSAELL